MYEKAAFSSHAEAVRRPPPHQQVAQRQRPGPEMAGDAAPPTPSIPQLMQLPLPLLEEVVAFVGDLGYTSCLLRRTSRGLAQLGRATPSLWGRVPHVRLRCQPKPFMMEERTLQALAPATAPGLSSLELVGDRRARIGYAPLLPVASLLLTASRLRSLTITHACLDNRTLAALGSLTALESLGKTECTAKQPDPDSIRFVLI